MPKKLPLTLFACAIGLTLAPAAFAAEPALGNAASTDAAVETLAAGDDVQLLASGDFEITVEGGDVLITDYRGSATGHLDIPAVVDGKTVTGLGYHAFADAQMTSVTIPEGIEWIERDCFINCSNLATVDFPNSLRGVEAGAFAYCPKLKADLPIYTVYVADDAFRDGASWTPSPLLTHYDGYYARTTTADVEGKNNYDYALRVLELVNEERAAAGLQPLTLDAETTEVAMMRAAECSILFSHTRPNGTDCFTAWSGGSAMGENIAAGYRTPEEVVNGWMNSPGHRANILKPYYTSLGIGCFVPTSVDTNGYGFYWTQCFNGKAASSAPLKSGQAQAGYSIDVLRDQAFDDIDMGAWYVTDGWLDYVVKQGIMSGAGTGESFNPDGSITRGELVTILYRYDQHKTAADTDNNVSTSFPAWDVAPGQFYAAAVKWASENGIVTGNVRADGSAVFAPNDAITREQLATIFARYAGYKTGCSDAAGNPVAPEASDDKLAAIQGAGDVSPYAYDAVAWCVDNGVMSGKYDTATGAPAIAAKDGATRAEASKMITVLSRDVL